MPENKLQTNPYKSKGGFKRIQSAFHYSMAGLTSTWKTEHAFRQEVMLLIPSLPFALMLPVSRFEKLALVAVLLLVLIVEMLNSAIEAVVDRVSFEYHPLAKAAKDYGSAAVLLTMALAALTWLCIVVPALIG